MQVPLALIALLVCLKSGLYLWHNGTELETALSEGMLTWLLEVFTIQIYLFSLIEELPGETKRESTPSINNEGLIRGSAWSFEESTSCLQPTYKTGFTSRAKTWGLTATKELWLAQRRRSQERKELFGRTRLRHKAHWVGCPKKLSLPCFSSGRIGL